MFISSFDSAHLVMANDLIEHDWIINLEENFHVTLDKEWFTIDDTTQRGQVWLGNGCVCKIVRLGDVQIKFQNCSKLTMTNVKHF